MKGHSHVQLLLSPFFGEIFKEDVAVGSFGVY